MGIKPTVGLISRQGVIPIAARIAASVTVRAAVVGISAVSMLFNLRSEPGPQSAGQEGLR